jgi:drug/metabolite transporter (DMT)-like permease
MLLIWGKSIAEDIKSHSVKDWIAPCLCIGTSLIVSNTALSMTYAANVSFVRSLSALIVPVLMFVFYKKKIRPLEYLLFGVILAGLYLLCGKNGVTGWGMGETLAFAAAVLGAGALAFAPTSLKKLRPITLSFLQASTAAGLCLVTGGVTGRLQFGALAQPQVALAIAYAAIFCTLGGFLLQNIALSHIPAKLVGMTQSLYPICSAFFASV